MTHIIEQEGSQFKYLPFGQRQSYTIRNPSNPDVGIQSHQAKKFYVAVLKAQSSFYIYHEKYQDTDKMPGQDD